MKKTFLLIMLLPIVMSVDSYRTDVRMPAYELDPEYCPIGEYQDDIRLISVASQDEILVGDDLQINFTIYNAGEIDRTFIPSTMYEWSQVNVMYMVYNESPYLQYFESDSPTYHYIFPYSWLSPFINYSIHYLFQCYDETGNRCNINWDSSIPIGYDPVMSPGESHTWVTSYPLPEQGNFTLLVKFFGDHKCANTTITKDISVVGSTAGTAKSPVLLHAYDSQGRHTGYDYLTGTVDYEIPGVEYSGVESHPQQIYSTLKNPDLIFYSRGYDPGRVTFNLGQDMDGYFTAVRAELPVEEDLSYRFRYDDGWNAEIGFGQYDFKPVKAIKLWELDYYVFRNSEEYVQRYLLDACQFLPEIAEMNIQEECDSLDNDCDGLIDEGSITLHARTVAKGQQIPVEGYEFRLYYKWGCPFTVGFNDLEGIYATCPPFDTCITGEDGSCTYEGVTASAVLAISEDLQARTIENFQCKKVQKSFMVR